MPAKIKYSVEVFKEDNQYIAICPELGVSSFGDSQKEAETSLKEAVTLFIEECQRMGTLEEVLEEAGYHASDKDRTEWVPREPLMVEKDEVAVAGR